DLHAIEEGARHLQAPDQLVLDDGDALHEVAARVAAAEEHVVAVVEREPRGHVARRRVPRVIYAEEDVARRRWLVAVELEAARRLGVRLRLRDGRGGEQAQGETAGETHVGCPHLRTPRGDRERPADALVGYGSENTSAVNASMRVALSRQSSGPRP